MKNKTLMTLGALALGATNSFGAIAWRIGTDDAPGQRLGPETFEIYGTTGTTTFVQENNNAADALPGDPNSPATNQAADDDFYFAGLYTNQVDGGAAYSPLGLVTATEVAIERAVTGGDPSNRIHFNFSNIHTASDVFTFSFAMLDINDNGTGTGQYDFDLFMNGVNIGSASHNAGTIGTRFSSNPFTLADVGATAGADDDNYVELVANNGGSTARWANFDYFVLEYEAVPEPSSVTFLAALAGLGLIRRRR
ncbi:MAG: PEP-CTERM sorting domain-containing protein [Akkermansiaceae bacterium]